MTQRLLDPRLLFGAASVLLLAVGAGMVSSAWRFTQDSRWVLESSQILRELDDIATLHERAVGSQRGYLLLPDAHLRDGFWDTRSRLLAETRALGRSVTDPRSSRLARELAPLVANRMDISARTLAIFERDGLAAAQRFIAGNGGRQLDNRIRASLESIRARQLELLRQRRGQLDSSASLVMVAAALGIPVSLAMLAMVNRALVAENARRRRTEAEAMASARDYKALSSDMESLSQFAGMLQSCEDAAELMAITARGFSVFAPALAGTVYLLRASRDHAEVAAHWGAHAVPVEPLPLPGQCWAMRRNQAYVCEDVSTGLPCTHFGPVEGNRTAATACIPLSAQGNLMGWLFLTHPQAGPLPGYGVALQAAEQLSLALANVRLRQDLRHQSIRDPLTGLYNRRYLEEALAREISRCVRRQLPLVVLMLDIDHFKAFNDVHGHPGGDALLAAFGRLLQANSRSEDIACRYGGEEFTVILPEADLATGIERARALLAKTAEMVATLSGTTLGRVTASIGIAALPVHGTTATELVHAADAALYRAKSAGRNRFEIAQAPAPPAAAG